MRDVDLTTSLQSSLEESADSSTSAYLRAEEPSKTESSVLMCYETSSNAIKDRNVIAPLDSSRPSMTPKK